MNAAFNLGDAGLAVNRELTQALEAWLDEEQIPWVDAYPAMQAGTTEYYWMQDYHLNVVGHDLVARELFAQQGPRLAAASASW